MTSVCIRKNNVSLCVQRGRNTLKQNEIDDYSAQLDDQLMLCLNVYSFHRDFNDNYSADVSFMLNSRLIYILFDKLAKCQTFFYQ